MSVEERDPVSGERLTGHDWNGIKELDTPIPRGVLLFLIITHIIAFDIERCRAKAFGDASHFARRHE